MTMATGNELAVELTLAQSAPTLLPVEAQHALQRGPGRITVRRLVHRVGSLAKAQAGLERRIVVGQRGRDRQGRKGRREQRMARSTFESAWKQSRVRRPVDLSGTGEGG